MARSETECDPHPKQCSSETNGSSSTISPSIIQANVMHEGTANSVLRYLPHENGPPQRIDASTKENGKCSGGVHDSSVRLLCRVSMQRDSVQSVRIAITSYSPKGSMPAWSLGNPQPNEATVSPLICHSTSLSSRQLLKGEYGEKRDQKLNSYSATDPGVHPGSWSKRESGISGVGIDGPSEK